MTGLADNRCEACRADAPRVTPEELTRYQKEVPDWRVVEVDGVKRLERTFKFRNFSEALAFTDKVGAAAEEQGHHPDIVTRWGETTVTWWSHKIRGLHRNDFVMAARTDRLYQGG
jgi:4a-hydroxytetrahydrobiopterin dehydratase